MTQYRFMPYNGAVNDAHPTAESVTLGNYIAQARRAEGLTQEKLAGRLGVTVSAVRGWEQDLRIPSPRALHFLAEIIPGIDAARMLSLIPSGTR